MKTESANVKADTEASALPQGVAQGDRIRSLVVREGGVELGFEGVKTHLPGVVKGLEMSFDRKFGGVMVHWSGRLPDGKHALRRIVIPLSNVKQFELE